MTISRLTYEDKGAAVQILSAAFANYPVMRYILKDSGHDYSNHLEALLGFFCETRLTRDWPLLGVLDHDELVAVAGINEPVDIPWPPALHQVYRDLAETIGASAFDRLESFEEQSSLNEPDQPHYFLGILGVAPGQQGKGYGRALIEALEHLSDANAVSTGIALSTESFGNIAFYEHLGFKVINQSKVGELQTWCLYRANAG